MFVIWNTLRPNPLHYLNKMWINLSRISPLGHPESVYQSNYSGRWELAVTGKKFVPWHHLGKALFSDYIVSSAKLADPDPVTAF